MLKDSRKLALCIQPQEGGLEGEDTRGLEGVEGGLEGVAAVKRVRGRVRGSSSGQEVLIGLVTQLGSIWEIKRVAFQVGRITFSRKGGLSCCII
jgi:hypothetical protein